MAKTYQESVRRGFLLRTQDMILIQDLVRKDEQTERVCAVYASLKPIRRATNTIRPREHGHTRTHPTSGQVLARVLGRPLFSERGRARHCSDAMATERVGQAVGNFTARRRSAKVRLGKTSVAKRHASKKRTVFTTRRRTRMSGGGGHMAYARRMRPVIPCSDT